MRTISRHSTFYDLLDALGKPGCAVCTIVARTRWRYLDSLAYENVNDPGVRAKLRESFGFCTRHAWYFVDTVRELFGAAIIYRDLLHTTQGLTAGATSANALDPSAPCLACQAEWDSAGYAIATLAEAIDEVDLRSAFDRSEGLCGPHLLRAMTVGRPGARQKLLDAALGTWQHHADDPARLRWRATGAAGNFATDDLALAANPPAPRLSVSAPLEEPFTCPVCTGTRAELGRLPSWESLDDGTGGLCNVHGWAPRGVGWSALHRRQVTALATRAKELASAAGDLWLRQAMRGLGLGSTRSEPIPSPLRCVVCAHQAAVETALCETIARPLCVPHLRRAVWIHGAGAIEAIKPTWRQLDQLLGEYLRKEDYRFRSEPRGIEQKSPRWIVALFAGVPEIR